MNPGDEEALQVLRESGADLAKPHKVSHYLYFTAKEIAREAAEALSREGFETESRKAAMGGAWLVLARHETVPSSGVIGDLRRRMESLASAHGGEYDGWEAEANP